MPHRTYVPRSVRITKRTLDIVGALVGLLLFLVTLPLLAVAVRMDSPGPIFYRQRRVGRGRGDRINSFKLIKYRSMRVDAELLSGPVLAQADDPRITRVGGILRKTRLDELPQFWHVLVGDMSLVGPRPERPEISEGLERKLPFFEERTYELRPGITGIAQVKMTYQECADDVPSKVSFDYAYSLALSGFGSWLRTDVSLLLRTVMICIRGRHG